jgi:D-beta-D-heptose 7-phosphate kinase / D-beta-D-heptose 1-phosphate adenosyltransferase
VEKREEVSIDPDDVANDSLFDRPSKFHHGDLGTIPPLGASPREWLDTIPQAPGSRDLRDAVDAIVTAHRGHRPVAVALGGRVIKSGCVPYLIDWVERGIVTTVAMNGAAAIHDLEMALAGATSEDVEARLAQGRFGMAREPAEVFSEAAGQAVNDQIGLGESLGRLIDNSTWAHRRLSLVAAAHRAGIPCTIHVAIGTDVVHMHPIASGADLGAASMTDFRLLCRVVRGLSQGVWINVGSAVILPEVFLKAVGVARNLGCDLDGLTAINLDMITGYRSRWNVLRRPASRGIELIGRQEIFLPLLHACVADTLGRQGELRLDVTPDPESRSSLPIPSPGTKKTLGPIPSLSVNSSSDLAGLVRGWGEPRILVVGDLILDRYTWGDAERISPEAPVLVLRSDRSEHRLGGAAGVARLLRGLGAKVSLLGLVGDDPEGTIVESLLDEAGIDRHAVRREPGRVTTLKERLMGRARDRQAQQILRVDREAPASLSPRSQAEFDERLPGLIADHDTVLISDYAKGACPPEFLSRLISHAHSAGKPVLVDPARGVEYGRYRGASAITPNRFEAGEAIGNRISSPDQALDVGRELCRRFDIGAAIVTLDRDGMALALRVGGASLHPTRPRRLCDVTGAGDMVLAALGLAIAGGASLEQAVRFANIAGGLEVERVGVEPISRFEILAELEPSQVAPGKVLALADLLPLVEVRRGRGERIVLTNGCFDLLHPGHLRSLEEAGKLGDCLVVALNSDAAVRRLKGPGRPILDQHGRSAMLAGLASVDFITPFDEDTPIELIRAIRPDVLVKGGDYALDEVVGRDIVESYGGTVILAKLIEGWSTTDLVRRIRNVPDPRA